MRIEGLDYKQASRSVRLLYDKCKRMLGHVTGPYKVLAHRPAILRAAAHMGRAMGASNAVEGKLKTLASIRAAQMIGCPF